MTWRGMATIVAGLGLPLAGCLLAAARHPAGVVPPPFGDVRLLIVTLILTMPLAGALSSWAAGAVTLRFGTRAAALGLAVVVAFAAALVDPAHFDSVLAALGRQLDSHSPPALRPWLGLALLHFLRFTAALAFGVLVTLALRPAWPAPRRSWSALFGLTALALLPTACYAAQRSAALETFALRARQQGRWWSAWQALQAARGMRVTEATARFGKFPAQIAWAVTVANPQGYPPDAPPWPRLTSLFPLEQHASAAEVLATLPADDTEALPWRIELALRTENWSEVERLIDNAPNAHLPMSWFSHDALAQALRGQGRWSEAEAVYHRLLASHVRPIAHWHWQLARHLELAGRPSEAVWHYRQVVDLEGAASEEAAARIRYLHASTPTCWQFFSASD